MMRGPDNSWLFVSTPKCATHSMYAALAELGGVRVGSFHATPSRGDVHRGTYVFSVCRHPLSRAVSLWRYLDAKASDNNHAVYEEVRQHCGAPVDFPGFVRWLVSTPTRDFNRQAIVLTQSAWHSRKVVTRFLRLESLAQDFEGLPFDTDGVLPHRLNATPRRPWQDYHTPETVGMLATWAADDFARFGYEPTLT